MVGTDQIITEEYQLLDNNNNNQPMTSFIFSKVKVKSQTQDWKQCFIIIIIQRKKHQSRRKPKRRRRKKQKKGRRKQNKKQQQQKREVKLQNLQSFSPFAEGTT